MQSSARQVQATWYHLARPRVAYSSTPLSERSITIHRGNSGCKAFTVQKVSSLTHGFHKRTTTHASHHILKNVPPAPRTIIADFHSEVESVFYNLQTLPKRCQNTWKFKSEPLEGLGLGQTWYHYFHPPTHTLYEGTIKKKRRFLSYPWIVWFPHSAVLDRWQRRLAPEIKKSKGKQARNVKTRKRQLLLWAVRIRLGKIGFKHITFTVVSLVDRSMCRILLYVCA